MNILNKLSPSYLVDKLITLFLKIVLAILLKTLYIIRGDDVVVTKVEVTIKKANKEKQYVHIIEASKEMTPPTPPTPPVDEETKTDPNLVTSTPSELKSEEIIKNEITNYDSSDNSDDEFREPIIRETPRHCPFEMKTSYNNNNGSDNDILPIKFCWKNGGQEVIITGDFDNWQGTRKMDYNPETKDFNADINIDRNKQHEFKFIVDGHWRPNWDLPTRTDEHGNVNNIIYAFPSGPLSPEYKDYAAPSFQLTAAY